MTSMTYLPLEPAATRFTKTDLGISVVIPVYKADTCLAELHRRLTSVLDQLTSSYEIVFVDDRSPDHSWSVLQKLQRIDPQVRLVRLSRNFGQHAAITAGLSKSTGDVTVVMDCDLQDPPELIPNLIQEINKGYDVVLAKRTSRNHVFWRVWFARLYFNLLGMLVGEPVKGEYGSFSAISRKVVDAFLRFNDNNRHYLMILFWLGFNRGEIEYEHNERFSGKSSYSLLGLVRHAMNGVMFQTTKTLECIIGMGFVISAGGALLALLLTYGYLIHSSVPGWTSLIVLILVMTGIILVSLGVVGMYIGQIFEQVKYRPLFVVAEEKGAKPADEKTRQSTN